MKKTLAGLMLVVALAGGASTGCMYGAMTTAQDGTLYVARNDAFLFGLLRKIFVCKPNGATLNCGEASDAP